MATASINVQAVTSTSEIHNTRTQSLSYVIEERIELNESWPAKEDMQSIADREKEVRSLCKELSGRKMRTSATPIREAVVNLAEETTMDDLLNLKDVLKEKFKVDCFQIHIHRDEGRLVDEKGKTQYTKVKGGWKSPEGKIIKDPTEQNPNLKFKENRHAHMVFDWQNKDTGKMIRHGKGIMSQMQTETAKALKMDRGELKTNSNRERLEPIEYKREQEQIRLNELQLEYEKLEQKKNRAVRRNAECADEHSKAEQRNREIEQQLKFNATAIESATTAIAGLEQEAERKIREIEQEDRRQSEARSQRISEFATNGAQFRKEWLRMDEIEQERLIQDLNTAASRQSTTFESQQREIADLTQSIYFEQEEIRKIEQRITSARRKVGI